MAYKTGTVAVTNGSPTVTGTGTEWLANASANDLFWITGDFANAGTPYRILSVGADTTITLTENYAGATISSGATYFISSDFTSLGYPRPQKGDVDPEAELQEIVDMINEDIASITTGTFSVPKSIVYLGQMVNNQEIRRNYVAKYAGTVEEVRIWCDTPPSGGDAKIRVQIGSGGSPTKYVEVTVAEGSNTGVNNTDSFAYSIGDEFYVVSRLAYGIASVEVNIYHVP